MTLGARHLSRARVPRDLHAVGRFFAVRAIRPGAGQIPVLVTMLLAGFHRVDMLPPDGSLSV